MTTINSENESKSVLKHARYHYGSFVVLADYTEEDQTPHNIRILGPQRMRLSIAGTNALTNACRIAEFMSKNPIQD